MRKWLYCFLALSVMFACKEKVEEVVDAKYPDGSKKMVHYYKEEGKTKILVKEIKYYENHQKQYVGELNNQIRDGKWTFWRRDGKLWSEGEFKNGKRNGKGTVYHENGKIFYECEYKDDERCGIWRFYDDKGKFIKEINYDELNSK
jgi:antitoxin component YwqK of YwqJK toxin-antitoxin module